jgi:hypothetical protein
MQQESTSKKSFITARFFFYWPSPSCELRRGAGSEGSSLGCNFGVAEPPFCLPICQSAESKYLNEREIEKLAESSNLKGQAGGRQDLLVHQLAVICLVI